MKRKLETKIYCGIWWPSSRSTEFVVDWYLTRENWTANIDGEIRCWWRSPTHSSTFPGSLNTVRSWTGTKSVKISKCTTSGSYFRHFQLVHQRRLLQWSCSNDAISTGPEFGSSAALIEVCIHYGPTIHKMMGCGEIVNGLFRHYYRAGDETYSIVI